MPDTPRGGADVINCTNVLPREDHYAPMPGLTVYSSALSARAQGAFAARDIDGTVFNFSGNATKLYSLSSATYSDVSRVSGGSYTAGADEQWNFTQFGRNIYATDFTDAIQSYTMGSSTNFAALAGSPPKARYMGIVGNDFLMLGNLDVGTYTVQWSPQGNPAGTWGTDAATLADKQDLASEWGWIKGVVGGFNGTIFQEHAITMAQFAGSPLGFQFYRVEENKGTQIPGSICKIGGGIFYRGFDGFYIFSNGQSIPIGAGKVDKFFQDDFDFNYLDRVRSVCDQSKMLVYMAYPSTNNVGGRQDRILVFNYSPNAQKRWSLIDLQYLNYSTGIECLNAAMATGYTLDTLDTLNTSIDALTASLDSEIYTGGQFNLAGFDSNNKLNYFTNSSLTATIDTGEFQPYPGLRSEVTLIRPLIEDEIGALSTTLNWKYRNKLSDNVTTIGTYSPLSSTGDIPIRANAFYHRGNVILSGGFSKALGIEVLEIRKGGVR